MLNRRQLVLNLSSCGALALALPVYAAKPALAKTDAAGQRLRDAIAALEKQSGGRLGVAVIDTARNQHFQWRSDERFPLCSTFKFILAAAILQRIDQGKEQLDRLIPVQKLDLVDNSPVSEKYVATPGASVSQLCEGSIIFSDNTAANLLLLTIGGPAGLTQFIRSLGDANTRLDRNEPELGEGLPGDLRDTTTPLAMLTSMRRLLLDDKSPLSNSSRAQLTAWLVDNRTGATRLRAGLPKTWKAGDKTGAGGHGSNNDVAIIWPPGKPPLLIASYLTECKLDGPGTQGIHANVAKAITAWQQA